MLDVDVDGNEVQSLRNMVSVITFLPRQRQKLQLLQHICTYKLQPHGTMCCLYHMQCAWCSVVIVRCCGQNWREGGQVGKNSGFSNGKFYSPAPSNSHHNYHNYHNCNNADPHETLHFILLWHINIRPIDKDKDSPQKQADMFFGGVDNRKSWWISNALMLWQYHCPQKEYQSQNPSHLQNTYQLAHGVVTDHSGAIGHHFHWQQLWSGRSTSTRLIIPH